MARLDEALRRRLTLISAPAGFGKTTLISEWLEARADASPPRAAAWLTLEDGDGDPTRFLTYVAAALGTIVPDVGQNTLSMLQGPQPPPTETLLAALLNEASNIPYDVILVLDDYHLVDAREVDQIVTYLIEHMPPLMHLIIATREDPPLPLARLRAHNQLVELRMADLRFTPDEAATFLQRETNLDLSADDVAAIEARTEGWIAGLQLAAISMRGQQDPEEFVASFTGSHRFVLDYLIEEVLAQQTQRIHTFLLRTSILDRLCGSLCDAVTGQSGGQQTLEYLDRANLFLIPLDTERRWYRYHPLFADLLRQSLIQSCAFCADDETISVEELHHRASVWYGANGQDVVAFGHAVAAGDIDRAARLVEGGGTPLQYQGATSQVLNWLASLPTSTLDARPALWVNYASTLTIAGQMRDDVEQKLVAAESALAGAAPGEGTDNLVGRIAAIRAMLAIPQNQADVVVAQSRLALAHLDPDNLLARTTASWTLGYGYQLQGDRAAARQVYEETLPVSRASGNLTITLGTTIALGQIQEEEGELHEAERTWRHVLELTGDPPLPFACAAYLGLARLTYEWNDLSAAEAYVKQSLALGRQLPNIDTPAECLVLLARVRLARGDTSGALRELSDAEAFAREHGFTYHLSKIAATRIRVYLEQGDLAAASRLAKDYDLILSKARLCLARDDDGAALGLLLPLRSRAEATESEQERLKVMILLAVALFGSGDMDRALQVLKDALLAGEAEGFVRSFLDEGRPMARLLSMAQVRGIAPAYTRRLLDAMELPAETGVGTPGTPGGSQQPLVEPLSERELEVLQLVANGLTNRQIAERLFIALSTVKGHNQRIYGKLQVSRRTEAIARARDLGLI